MFVNLEQGPERWWTDRPQDGAAAAREFLEDEARLG